jgi:prepilin-type processing-associated H-X9-DG protein
MDYYAATGLFCARIHVDRAFGRYCTHRGARWFASPGSESREGARPHCEMYGQSSADGRSPFDLRGRKSLLPAARNQQGSKSASLEIVVRYASAWALERRPLGFRCPSFKYFHIEILGNGVPISIGVGSYGYNALSHYALSPRGIEYESEGIRASIAEERVKAPARMIAIGDSYLFKYQGPDGGGIEGQPVLGYSPLTDLKKWGGYNDEVRATTSRHSGKYNLAFCDGHVEGIKFFTLFADNPEARRLWNLDNEPHL